MSYNYIKRYYGNNTYFKDDSWKRMQRYNASHGDTLIFNFNSCGCGNGYYSTNCGNGGTFWGGFGAGIGFGLVNFAFSMLSGFLGGFMGMPMFGGMGAFNNYGTVPNYVGGFGGFTNYTPVSETDSSKKAKKEDEEESDVEKIIKKVNEVNNDNSTVEAIQEVIDEIDEKLKDKKNITAEEQDDLTNAKDSLVKQKNKIESKAQENNDEE